MRSGVRGARAYHLMGTARMGADPRKSVVNASRRAHDVPNLYVVDGSSFTTSAAVNPTSTIRSVCITGSRQDLGTTQGVSRKELFEDTQGHRFDSRNARPKFHVRQQVTVNLDARRNFDQFEAFGH
jgi:hypothetical protein